MHFTQLKFLSLKIAQQHARAADCCKEALSSFTIDEALFAHYLEIAAWMELPPIQKNVGAIQDRFHFHTERCGKGSSLPWISSQDSPSPEPFLPIAIYLDRLRSAHNIGSIIRTTEALRCGHIHISPGSAGPQHMGVRKTAMETERLVPVIENSSMEELPKPLILLETAPAAQNIDLFTFPKPPFTLAVGNEELGCHPDLLERADAIVTIPLFGMKNSLNVAVAYAIAAHSICQQLRPLTSPVL